MNKKITLKSITVTFIVLLTVLTSSNVMAQLAHTWSTGPEIGVNFSKYGMDGKDSDFKPGLLVGGFLTYSIEETYGFTMKFLFSQKGAKNTVSGVTYRQTLNYVEIPFVFRYFLNKDGKFRPNLFVGPSLGILTGGNNKQEDQEAVKFTEAQENQFENLDFGITGGVGFNYEIKEEVRILLDARYTRGASDITNPGEVNNQVISLSFGVSFGF